MHRTALLPRLAHVTTVLAAIAVPLVGWFVGGWSGATTLVVYWAETLAICVFAWARVVAHQRLAPRRGHYRYQAPGPKSGKPSSFASGFLLTAGVFSFAHGVFMAAIIFLLHRNGYREIAEIDWRSVGLGCLSVVAFLLLDFLVDLPTLREWSFRDVELTANRGLSRVVVIHLTLILGLAGVAVTDAPDTLFGVFVVLKALTSLSWALPQWEPKTPPKWMSRVLNRVPNVRPGERFEDFWAKENTAELNRRERNDEPWT